MSTAPEHVDAGAAERALAVAHDQRAKVLLASQEPWWMWPAACLVLMVMWASKDIGDGSSLLPHIVLWTWLGFIYLPRVSRRIAARLGRQVQGRRDLIPTWFRALTTLVAIAPFSFLLLYGEARFLQWVGAPAWAVAHPNATTAIPLAVCATATMWGLDRLARAWLTRPR